MSFRLHYSRWLVALALVTLTLIFLSFFTGIRMNADPYRGVMNRWLSQQLGRSVHINGNISLTLSLRPELIATDIQIDQPQRFGTQDFARLGKLQFRLDLLPLWHGQWRADSLSASDVQIALIQTSTGDANWIFHPEITQPSSPSQKANSPTDIAAHFDIRLIRIERLLISYQGAGSHPSQLLLEKLEARLPADGQLAVDASGRVNKDLPYSLKIRGGSLQQLTEAKTPWALSWQLNFAESTFNAYGTFSPQESQFRFGLGTNDIAGFGKLLNIHLPNAGVAGVSGLLKITPGAIQLDELSAQLGHSSMTGKLSVDTRNERPRLGGKLDVARLDLRPFLGQDTEEEPATDLPSLYRSLSRAQIDLAALNHQDIDVILSVDQWISLPGNISDTRLAISLNRGKFMMPIQARIEGVAFKVDVIADASRAVPSFQIALSSDQADAGGLARLLTGIPGIEGQSGRLRFTINSQGRDGAALMKALAIQIDLRDSQLSYGNLEGSRPVAFRIQQMNVELPAGKALQGRLRGSLLDKAINVEIRGSDLRSSMQNASTEFTLTAAARGFTAHFTSVINAEKGDASLSFSLGAEHAGDVATWLGLRSDARGALSMAGRFFAGKNHWQLSDLVLQAGNSSLHANLQRREINNKPFYDVEIDVAQYDAVELDTMLASSKASGAKLSTLDIPILPRQLVLDDANIRVRVASLKTSSINVSNLGFDAQVQNGFMQSSPFFAELANHRFDGAVMVDTRSSEPHAQLWLFAKNLDVGRITRDLKLAQGLEFTAERFSFYLDSHSSRLATLIANAQLLGEISGGYLQWSDVNNKNRATVQLNQGKLSASPGERLTLSLHGSVDKTPVDLLVRSASVKDLLNPQSRVPFALNISIAKSQLALSGTLHRNLDERDLELQLNASGERLDNLTNVARVSLPPWGPWLAQGAFKVTKQGYSVEGLNLIVGSSQLQGQGLLDTTTTPSRLIVNLAAPQLQLDDFPLSAWSATPAKQSTTTNHDMSSDELRKKATDASDQIQSLLSAHTLRSINAAVNVRVDRVIAGSDRLGAGELKASFAEGRAIIAPIRILMPGGSANASLTYQPRDQDVLSDLKIDVDQFDYGVVARRFKPSADVDGRFSLHVDVHSQAPRLSEVIKHGSGTLDFFIWPNEMKANIFDLWAVNLFVALLPTIDPNSQSKVNCAIGRFSLKDGKLNQRQLVIDTSKVRVTGNTEIDLAKETLHMRLQPQAKTAQFLSLATPLEVQGSLDKFSIGPNAGDVFETVIRFATSIVWVPIKRLFSEKVPEDGRDVCGLSAAR